MSLVKLKSLLVFCRIAFQDTHPEDVKVDAFKTFSLIIAYFVAHNNNTSNMGLRERPQLDIIATAAGDFVEYTFTEDINLAKIKDRN